MNIPLTIAAVGLAWSLMLPQMRACVNDGDARQAAKLVVEEKRQLDHWNSYVEPTRKLCLDKGGWPTLVDLPNTGRWEWQVQCDFPATK